MTVEELIDELAAFPPDMEVRVSNSAGTYSPITPKRVVSFTGHRYDFFSGAPLEDETYVLLDDGTTLP